MEITFIPRTKFASQYEGVFLFTDVARMIRPVYNLLTNTIEYIGSFEQVLNSPNICNKNNTAYKLVLLMISLHSFLL